MGNFSKEWENTYKAGAHTSIWPWSDLVSFVMRYAKPNKSTYKVLELGCGPGANIAFFKSLDIEYFAIEGSESIVNSLHKKYPELKRNILPGDFTNSIAFDGKFDLIIDRASLTHNTTNAIKNALKLVSEKLLPGGVFIGIDWFSTEHSDYKKGRSGDDQYTRTGMQEGQFVGLGRVHFSDQKHIEDLFKDYVFITMQHKTVRTTIPGNNHTFASWNFAAKKL
ncbi:MAG TPA: class I SAM-dependent methyltransferase [Ferruginibacter sp.]|jgi:SAM-dependent methyltransferase|nr:class I SAM-dependent methyltransferase [Ferruginibacter sp.]